MLQTILFNSLPQILLSHFGVTVFEGTRSISLLEVQVKFARFCVVLTNAKSCAELSLGLCLLMVSTLTGSTLQERLMPLSREEQFTTIKQPFSTDVLVTIWMDGSRSFSASVESENANFTQSKDAKISRQDCLV